jgi:hypothetical protein
MPSAPSTAAVATDSATGQRKFRLRLSGEAFRQAINCPTLIRSKISRKSGTVTREKYGAPTESLTPVMASATSGKMVPRNTVKVAAARTTLVTRKADSRLNMESISGWERSRSARTATRAKEPRRTRARKPRNSPPTGPEENAWTEESTPLRVRNVPKMVSANATMISERFQTLSIPRRSWIWIECSSAVAGSQGRNDAFSTGSHAQ